MTMEQADTVSGSLTQKERVNAKDQESSDNSYSLDLHRKKWRGVLNSMGKSEPNDGFYHHDEEFKLKLNNSKDRS